MATVSELCEAIAQAASMPLDEVKKFARALINSGDLPKAIGRSIPKTDMHHRAKLILAIAASERPADCVKAMRDRYEAVAFFGGTELTAGEVLAQELRELASKNSSAFQTWTYSKLEVSRGGTPSVQFRINEAMQHFDNVEKTKQPLFLGGAQLAKDADEKIRLLVKQRTVGFPVSAFVSGHILMVAAFGSVEASLAAEIEVAKAFKNNPDRAS